MDNVIHCICQLFILPETILFTSCLCYVPRSILVVHSSLVKDTYPMSCLCVTFLVGPTNHLSLWSYLFGLSILSIFIALAHCRPPTRWNVLFPQTLYETPSYPMFYARKLFVHSFFILQLHKPLFDVGRFCWVLFSSNCCCHVHDTGTIV